MDKLILGWRTHGRVWQAQRPNGKHNSSVQLNWRSLAAGYRHEAYLTLPLGAVKELV